jgi:hypothetical protein
MHRDRGGAGQVLVAEQVVNPNRGRPSPERMLWMNDVNALPDAELLAAARRGDSAAFERLVSGHRRELYAHCYRML